MNKLTLKPELSDILRAENDDLKIKLEEAETDLALLREEAEVANSAVTNEDGSVGVSQMQIKLKDEEIKRLKVTVFFKVVFLHKSNMTPF